MCQVKKWFVMASWKMLAIPKVNGLCGLKNPFVFSKSLTTKSVWRSMQGTWLWLHVIEAKYIAPHYMEYWIRNLVK